MMPYFGNAPTLGLYRTRNCILQQKGIQTIVSLGVSQTTKPKEFPKGVHISNYTCKLNLVNVNFVGLIYQRKTQHT
jgi:hypothetical protein